MRINLTGAQVQQIFDEFEASKKRRAEAMPSDQDALMVLQDAYQRLKELGWREAIYCPKDGNIFDAIEAGSTGIHDCHYMGKWPDGGWWVLSDGDAWPSRPILFRLKPSTAQAERTDDVG